ncbi:MAG: hypothetical protein US11_C0006G0026 [Candidatus Roizmanbacteria bacterium GW2011_GWA2_36_23]|uniref:Peptidase C39-like domain-containing protein n=1 Tax=Candidatus Roizmanbacteria bacterium GW2011_GWA2_36_23 TaxID=1618480 RepID=A0A0G0GP76_9BACT|nr:MAG: hypothetical protein US11_C0006G0026 [Candidatus Roizmanbacteria bacterium GW2011_GWA2_36_23]
MKQKLLIIGVPLLFIIIIILNLLLNKIGSSKNQEKNKSQISSTNQTVSNTLTAYSQNSNPQDSPTVSPSSQMYGQNNSQKSLSDNQFQKEYAALNVSIIPYQSSMNENSLSAFNDLMNIFLQFNPPSSQPTLISPTSTITITPTITPNLPNENLGKGLTYYQQCESQYDKYPLPGGCNICKAGCGPTTVAMILSSFVDNRIDPPAVVDLYKQNNYVLACIGSKIIDAKSILEQQGMLTTDLLYYPGPGNNEAVQDFKMYIKNGWTMFALARFCEEGCGHFFWIVDVDEKDNVWAYDPSYGRNQLPPFNENQYDPFPKYKFAFGVKKN